MARKPKAETASTTDTTEETNTEEATRAGVMHQAFADFLNAEHDGGGITAEQVFLVTSKRKAFRSTESYRNELAPKSPARVAAATERAAAKEANAKARAEAKTAKEAAAAQRATDKATKEADKATTAAAKKAAAPTKKAKKTSAEAIDEANSTTPAPRAKGKGKKVNPF